MNKIGCIVMASGCSARYGSNKLLETAGGREIILHTVYRAAASGLEPLTVTRSAEVYRLLRNNGFNCILHDKPQKSDTIHIGLKQLVPGLAGCLFIPGDQPLILPSTLRRMTRQFLSDPDAAVRLGFGETAASPVLFPSSMREALLSYEGDRGGVEVLRRRGIRCSIVQAAYEWELWDADTPESMKKIRDVIKRLSEKQPMSPDGVKDLFDPGMIS